MSESTPLFSDFPHLWFCLCLLLLTGRPWFLAAYPVRFQPALAPGAPTAWLCSACLSISSLPFPFYRCLTNPWMCCSLWYSVFQMLRTKILLESPFTHVTSISEKHPLLTTSPRHPSQLVVVKASWRPSSFILASTAVLWMAARGFFLKCQPGHVILLLKTLPKLPPYSVKTSLYRGLQALCKPHGTWPPHLSVLSSSPLSCTPYTGF